jgi:hypothetical protein
MSPERKQFPRFNFIRYEVTNLPETEKVIGTCGCGEPAVLYRVKYRNGRLCYT